MSTPTAAQIELAIRRHLRMQQKVVGEGRDSIVHHDILGIDEAVKEIVSIFETAQSAAEPISPHLKPLPKREAELERAFEFLMDKRVSAASDDLTGCTSYIQRRLQCGYSRAADLLDDMVERGWITEIDQKGARRIKRFVQVPVAE